MNELAIEILKHMDELGRPTDSNELIKDFQNFASEGVITAIESLCGETHTSGYISWHKSSRGGDSPFFDRLALLPKGKELLQRL